MKLVKNTLIINPIFNGSFYDYFRKGSRYKRNLDKYCKLQYLYYLPKYKPLKNNMVHKNKFHGCFLKKELKINF
jgi:hypothetical protein